MKLQGTNIFSGEKDLNLQTKTQLPDGTWVTARPIGFQSFIFTLQCAWDVLRHRADIIIWREEQK